MGKLRVQTIALATAKKSAEVRVNGQPVAATSHGENGRVLITLYTPATIEAGQTLKVSLI